MNAEILWVSLFVFLVVVVVFSVGSIGAGKPYWKFGIGFGLVFCLIFPLVESILPNFKSWSVPAVLFIVVPLFFMGMALIFLLATYVGVIFYGRTRWEEDKDVVE